MREALRRYAQAQSMAEKDAALADFLAAPGRLAKNDHGADDDQVAYNGVLQEVAQTYADLTRNNVARAFSLAAIGEIRRSKLALGSHGKRDIEEPGVESAIRSKYPSAVDANEETVSADVVQDIKQGMERPSLASFAEYLRSRPRHSGPGPSGMTFEHLRDVVRDDEGAAHDLINLIFDIQRGDISEESRPLIVNARGVALAKEAAEGQAAPSLPDIRPCGIYEVVTRLASGLLVAANREVIAMELGDCEYGFGVPGGAEALAHAVSATLESEGFENHVTAVLDAKNAFNSIKRRGPNGLLEAVRRGAPGLLPYVMLVYGKDTSITYASSKSDKKIQVRVQRGAAQGDPSGPLIFGLTVKPAMQKLRSTLQLPEAPQGPAVPGKVFTFFDNMTVITTRSRVALAIKKAAEVLQPIGLELQPPKTEVYCRGGADAALVAQLGEVGATRPVSSEGIVVVGAAIGSLHYMRDYSKRVATEICKQVDTITAALGDPVDPITLGAKVPVLQGLMLVGRVAEAPRFNFFLRSMPPQATREAAQMIDAAMERFVAALAGFDLNAPPLLLEVEVFGKRVHLPLRNGGAGVVGLAGIAEAAWTAGVAQAMPHVRRHAPSIVKLALAPPADSQAQAEPQEPQPVQPLPPYITRTREAIAAMKSEGAFVAERLDGFDPFAEAPPPAAVGAQGERPMRIQQMLSKALHDSREKDVLAHLNASGSTAAIRQQQAAAFLSGGDGGGAWLSASPTFNPNKMENKAFQSALRMRLGVPFREGHGTCTVQGCNHAVDDAWGLHAFRCRGPSGVKSTRHNMVRDAVAAIARQSGLQAATEVPYEEHYPRKVGGAESGVTHRIDVHVTLETGEKVVVDTTVRHPTHGSAHLTRGVTAKAAEKFKGDFITVRYMASRNQIKTVALETYGVMGEEGQALLRHVAGFRAGENKAAYAQLVNLYRTRIAVAVQRGNLLVINRWLRRHGAAAPALPEPHLAGGDAAGESGG